MVANTLLNFPGRRRESRPAVVLAFDAKRKSLATKTTVFLLPITKAIQS